MPNHIEGSVNNTSKQMKFRSGFIGAEIVIVKYSL
jgi:hypothetical protein